MNSVPSSFQKSEGCWVKARQSCKFFVMERAHLEEKLPQQDLQVDHSKAEVFINMPAQRTRKGSKDSLEDRETCARSGCPKQ